MALIPQQYECDRIDCKATKREINHWIAVLVENLPAGREVLIYDWDVAVLRNVLSQCKHFCGINHALLFVSEVMEKKKPVEADACEPKETPSSSTVSLSS